jgi:tRNA(fMet)-specific endonuclease VapC
VNLILDTNALSSMIDGDTLLRSRVTAAGNIFIPVVVLGEYRFGILQSSRRADYEAWIAEYTQPSQILAMTEATAVHYAEIRLELKRAGTPIPVNDLWIAALCRQHNLPILTRDHHFDRVPGLQRQTW